MPKRLLLVEGADDLHVMSALFLAHRLPDAFKVIRPNGDGGINVLLKAIPTRLKESDLERLAIIVDADEDLQKRWNEIRHILLHNGATDVPVEPSVGGTILRMSDEVIVGIWLMPDNRVPGILESFLAFLTPAENPLLAHVNTFIDTIPETCVRCPPGRIPKARIHAWLSVQNEPGKPLGQAVTAKYLDAHAEVVNPFVAWVRSALVD